MNHHYIEFMIKERQKEEREECERRRLLRDADLSNAGLVRKISCCFASLICRYKKQLVSPNKRLNTRSRIADGK